MLTEMALERSVNLSLCCMMQRGAGMLKLAEVSKSQQQSTGWLVNLAEKQLNTVPQSTLTLHRWNPRRLKASMTNWYFKIWMIPVAMQLWQVRSYIESGCNWGLLKYSIKIQFACNGEVSSFITLLWYYPSDW